MSGDSEHQIDSELMPDQRRAEILRILAENGSATVRNLSSRFSVVPMTIRRDLETLEREKELIRVHGGAVIAGQPMLHRRLQDKETLNIEAKRTVGSRAASLIEDGETVILDEGSTCMEVARALRNRSGITVVTNGVRVAMELIPASEITTILIGGICGRHNYVAYGHETVEAFQKIRAHRYIMGIDALQSGHGISDCDPHQVQLKQVKASVSEEVIGVADVSKVGQIAVCRVGSFGLMDTLIMNGPIPPSFRDSLEGEGVRLLEV